MKKPITPKRNWSIPSGETVLREEQIDHVLRDKEESDSPIQKYIWGIAVLASGGYFGLERARDFMADTSSYADLVGLILAVLVIALGSFILSRPPRNSPWKEMDKYVFTDHQIVLLDEAGNLMDQIAAKEIEEILEVDNFISVFRRGDPELRQLFEINYVPERQALLKFLKKEYEARE